MSKRMKRRPLSKKIRFEVFKRDSFACQYCGSKAPDILLHVDHIKPVSKGGNNAFLNLITSCRECNQGKSNRELNDRTVIEQSRKQLDVLNEKSEQLKMMIDWLSSLDQIENTEFEYLAAKWKDATEGLFHLNKTGKQTIKQLIKKYDLERVKFAMDIAVEQYFRFDTEDNVTANSIEYAFNKIPGICRVNELDPDSKKIYYIRGILRRRTDCDERESIILMKRAVELDVDLEALKQNAINCYDYKDWRRAVKNFIEEHG